MDNNFLEKSDFASAPLAVYSFEPAAFLISKGAKKLWKNHRTTARFVLALQYLTNPVDRAIQLVVTPLFTIVSYIYATHAGYGKKFPDGNENSKLAKVGYLGFRATVFLPTVATKTVLIWISLAANTAIHLFPFKVISACRDNRPVNFTARRAFKRETMRADSTYASPGLEKALLWGLSLLVSDKGLAQQLLKLKQGMCVRLNPLDDDSRETRRLVPSTTTELQPLIDEYRAQALTRDASTLPANKQLKFQEIEADREVFVNYLFTNFQQYIRNCDLSYFEEMVGLESAFFLPKNTAADQKAEELAWRFKAYQVKIKQAKELAFLRDFIGDGAFYHDLYYRRDTEWKDRYRDRLLRLEAVITYTYRELTKPPAPETKNARKV